MTPIGYRLASHFFLNFVTLVVMGHYLAILCFSISSLILPRPMNRFRIWITYAPTLKQRMRPKCAPLNFWALSRINLIYTLLSQIKLCSDYALFGGHFWPNFGGGRHYNILMDQGCGLGGLRSSPPSQGQVHRCDRPLANLPPSRSTLL